MRQVKEHNERKNEIIDVAEVLFYSKGYESCTINDILKEVGIAKGTFYHYFSSKEDILDAVLDRIISQMMARIHGSLSSASLNYPERLMQVFLAMRVDDIVDDQKRTDIHMPDNALLHQKALSKMIESITPILVQIVEDGIAAKVWECKFPREYMQIFLASSLTLTDEGIFNMDAETQNRIMIALITILEKMLCQEALTFVNMYIDNWQKPVA